MDNLNRRLRRLGGGKRPCPECGHGAGGPVEIVFGGRITDERPFVPKYCGTCGRQLNFTLDLGAMNVSTDIEED